MAAEGEVTTITCSEQTVEKKNILECPVCYQFAVHPVKLPCNHIFCFLCAKGVAYRTRKCAICRGPIPAGYLDNPELVDKSDLNLTSHEDTPLWFYQARGGGWWLYEKRTALELEEKYQKNAEDIFDLVIVGCIYTIDFKNMVQYRKENSSVRRTIKRDLINNNEVKGHAGLRLPTSVVKSERPITGSESQDDPISSPTQIEHVNFRHNDEADGMVTSQQTSTIGQTLDEAMSQLAVSEEDEIGAFV